MPIKISSCKRAPEIVDKSFQPLPAGGDSSQDEAEEEAKAITVNTDSYTQ